MHKNWFLEIIIAKGHVVKLDAGGKMILNVIQFGMNIAMVKKRNGNVVRVYAINVGRRIDYSSTRFEPRQLMAVSGKYRTSAPLE
jgi:hypothetical protein